MLIATYFDCNTASLLTSPNDEVDCLHVAICSTLVRYYCCISSSSLFLLLDGVLS